VVAGYEVIGGNELRLAGYSLHLDYDKSRLRVVEREVYMLKKLYPVGRAIIKLSSRRGNYRNYGSR